jgi:hypothetical protein
MKCPFCPSVHTFYLQKYLNFNKICIVVAHTSVMIAGKAEAIPNWVHPCSTLLGTSNVNVSNKLEKTNIQNIISVLVLDSHTLELCLKF